MMGPALEYNPHKTVGAWLIMFCHCEVSWFLDLAWEPEGYRFKTHLGRCIMWTSGWRGVSSPTEHC